MWKWLFFLICSGIGFAAQIDDIQKAIETAPPKTLVLLDVGGTLLIHKDAVLQPLHKEWKAAWYEKNFPNLSRQEKVELSRILQQEFSNWQLTDPKWLDIMALAEKKGIQVAALTKTTLDPLLKGVRRARLAAHGIVFKDELSLPNGELYTYDNGLIQTEADFKGPVLEEVIKHLKERPPLIIFVDNRPAQIESVKNACEKLGIPCIAIEYQWDKTPLLDEKIASYQLYVLVTEHRWLTEKEVRACLNK